MNKFNFLRIGCVPAVLIVLLFPNVSLAKDFNDLTPADQQQAVLAFVHLTSAPGVQTSDIDVNLPNRQSDLDRTVLGFASNLTIKGWKLEGYWGAALLHGLLDESINFGNAGFDDVNLHLKREINSAKATIGVNFPFTRGLSMRTYGSVIRSRLDNTGTLEGLPIDPLLEDAEFRNILHFASDVNILSGSLSLEVTQMMWWKNYGLTLTGHYTSLYSDMESADSEILNTWSWSDNAYLSAELSGPTQLRLLSRDTRWRVYSNHTNYLGQNKIATGFTYLNEVGLGLDFEINIKPLDWFGWRYIGVKTGFVWGDDARGYNLGLTAR